MLVSCFMTIVKTKASLNLVMKLHILQKFENPDFCGNIIKCFVTQSKYKMVRL